ncbi:antibiotic biosynthesis monooxygenase family protein [Roseateles sp.]|uniref:antibiotic biosynthesis monooxygenase family protein n=1 Tax=Roseateles sp. TaxID=1971397 RepID=UPI00286A845B|nr:antibiotic biosynthesis monooxygenase family protein [Roseateles sp.]
MILEIAEIQIQPGQQADFEAAIANAIKSVISQAQGFISARVQHGLESPERYILQIEWATLEDHTLHFRNGPLFPAWRAIVGPFFAQPPRVEHYQGVI